MNHRSARSAAFSRVLQGCALPLLLLAVGCAVDRGVTDSRAGTGGVQRSSAPNESPFSWSEDLAGPSTNYENGGSIGWTGVPLAGGRWYRVRVSGQTSLINNPAWMNVCTQAGVAPCPPGTYVGSYGPEGVPGSEDLRVLVRTSSGYEFRWTSPAQEFVFFLPHGGTVQRMQRGLVSGITCLTAEPCRGSTGTWTGEYGFYTYTSRPRIEIEGASIPVRVTADRSWAGAQDLVTYTAQADVPRVHDGANTWFYVPGDTAATPLFPSNEPLPVNACWGKTTCSFASGVYGPGRMYVNWYTKYGTAQNASPVIGAQPPKLVLNCPASVQRGSAMTCTVTAQGGAMQNPTWTFTDATGNIISAPAGTSTTWGGTMVVGGTMRVSATVGGVPKDTTDTIAVSPRTWAGMMPYPSALPSLVLTPDRFRDIPVRDSAGIDVWLKGGLAVYEYGINWRGRLNQVPSGPNHGYWYFTQPPPWLNPEVLYSGYLDPGNPFYEAQTGQRAEDPAAPSGYTRGWCEKTDMDVLRQEVFYHEGNVSGPRLSHHQLNKDYTAKHDPAPKVESVVFYLTDQSVSLAKRMDSELGAAYLDQLALAHESQVHAPTNLYTVPCKVHIP